MNRWHASVAVVACGAGLLISPTTPIARLVPVLSTVASATEVASAGPPPGGRDPFLPFLLARRAVPPSAPLQRYELGELAVVATISGRSLLRALVEDDSGTGFIVSVGTTIGRAGGVVEAIGRMQVVVAESGVDSDGHPRTVRVVLRTRDQAATPEARPVPR